MSPLAPRIGLAAAIFLLFICASLEAQTFDQIGERAQGMGGAFVAVADDASAIYWNPAGLSNVFKFDAQLNVNGPDLPADLADAPNPTRAMFAGAALPMLGLAYYRVRTGVSDSESRKNEGSGEVRVSALTTRNFGASLVQTVVKTVVVGSTLRVVNGAGHTAFDLDAGAMASAGNIRAGFVARNLREALGIERQVRVGFGLVPRALPTGVHGPFSLAVDADLTRSVTLRGESRQAAVGSEQWWRKGMFGTRVGMRWNTLDAAQLGVSGGFTVKFRQYYFTEGHVTKYRETDGSDWGIGAGITF